LSRVSSSTAEHSRAGTRLRVFGGGDVPVFRRGTLVGTHRPTTPYERATEHGAVEALSAALTRYPTREGAGFRARAQVELRLACESRKEEIHLFGRCADTVNAYLPTRFGG
jgi:hypothetical protein